MAKSKSSKRWLAEHFDDHYVKLAQQQGLRSRAAFKLIELNEKYGLLKKGMRVVDLGSAPGGWTQVVQRELRGNGRVIALDILPMPAIPGVAFIEGDFGSEEGLQRLESELGDAKADLVMSDMAPNMMGIAQVDHARSMNLVELAVEFALANLRPGGDFLVKVFQGREFQPLLTDLRGNFESVKLRKPKASRNRSAEVYVLARGFRLV